jgi:hypothetical protein
MTTKSPLAAVALSPEEEPEVQRYKDAQAELRRALEARQNPLFDPVLLAMAQGFLTPTKSGSFGEALGTAASLVGPAQAAEQKRVLEMAQLRSQLAASELEQGRKSRALKMEQDFMRGLPSAEPSGQAGQPAAPSAAGVSGAVVPVENRAQGQNQYGLYPPDLIDRIRRLDPERADVMDKSNKARMDQIKFLAGEVKTTEAGSYSVDPSGKVTFTPRPGGKEEEAFVPGVGPVSMSPDDLIKFRAARETLSQNPNDSAALREFYRLIDKYRGAAPARPTPAGAPAGEAPAAVKGPMTPGEAEIKKKAEEAAAVTRATEETKAEVGRTQQALETGSDVTGRMAQYASLRAIAARPDANQIFGIFNRPDVGSAILNLVQEGVKSPGATSIQVGALEDALRNVGLKQDQIDRYRFALGTMANIQLQMAKLAQGQGAVSNFERELFASASISPRDNPQTILGKLSMLEERAKFDRAIFSALRKSKMSADDFKDSEEYQRLADGYLSRVAGIAANFGAARPAARPATSAPTTDAGERLRRELGIR